MKRTLLIAVTSTALAVAALENALRKRGESVK